MCEFAGSEIGVFVLEPVREGTEALRTRKPVGEEPGFPFAVGPNDHGIEKEDGIVADVADAKGML